MPLRLDIKKLLSARSERVKCVDIHPTEPWVLAALYDGHVFIYDYTTQQVVKSWEVSEQPIRCGAFIPRQQWVIVGADDMFIRVYNYNTMDKVATFEAHQDYIRSVAMHPTLPLVVSCSDDMLIKIWDWEKGWSCMQVLEGHSHYIMQVKFNPKDPNTFATASLDHTVKVWSLSSPVPNYTLEGHEKGVNSVDYYSGGDKPYLVTGSDDKSVKIWDYQTKSCVTTLTGHNHNVSAVAFLPDRPLIVSGSEDGSVLLWHANTYRLETTLNYGLDRCWSVAYLKGSNLVALGFDNGSVLLQLGKDEPVASMDHGGKVILAKHNEISTVNVRNANSDSLRDGERVVLPSKELGSCEIYPQSVAHSPNGRFVAVCGDGEYIIYTALAWRNKAFGTADEVVWDGGAGEYAVRIGPSDVRVYNKAFQERTALRVPFQTDAIFGGALLGVRGPDFVCFYDWETLALVRRIDVTTRSVYWSDSAGLVAVASQEALFVLSYDRGAVDAALDASGGTLDADGVEDAFELLHQVPDTAHSGRWVGDCFVYTNGNGRLNYTVGAEVATLFHLDRPLFLLGYLPKEDRLYLVDKDGAVVSFELLLAVLEFKTAIVRGDKATADAVLGRIPKSEHNKLARFLESQGLREGALELATDGDYRCELALALGKLELAASIAREFPSELKWRQLSELAAARGVFDLAEECMDAVDDFAGLLTLHTASGNRESLSSVASAAGAAGKMNVAFLSHFLVGDLNGCIDQLLSAGRAAEATIFARTYLPSAVPRLVQRWRSDLRKAGNVRIADALGSPDEHAHLFPTYAESLESEKAAATLYKQRASMPASAYPDHAHEPMADVAELLRGLTLPTAMCCRLRRSRTRWVRPKPSPLLPLLSAVRLPRLWARWLRQRAR
eukprot:TRINITY_DN4077_c0_g1_i1.p1 TRINITY_DN4077_c0_g1~~TRINITY_DN4077_c0_g1_i1.p1  ORF type:complete len:964 (+),score=310.33 TRINITY_DN4077_c0_g1_i1:209-2893(+)